MVLVFGLICALAGLLIGVCAERLVSRKENEADNDWYYAEGYNRCYAEIWGSQELHGL